MKTVLLCCTVLYRSQVGQYTEQGASAANRAADLNRVAYGSAKQHSVWKTLSLKTAASLVRVCWGVGFGDCMRWVRHVTRPPLDLSQQHHCLRPHTYTPRRNHIISLLLYVALAICHG